MTSESEDGQLLRLYAEKGDEAAFGELVRRHINVVYGCALRRVGGDAHLAEDVTQQVFRDLARRARNVAGHAVLGGWLYTSTRFAAAHVVRTEQRRRARERAALTMNVTTDDEAPTKEWERLRPVLDETIDELDERDRTAVVLRYFEGRSFAEIGAQLRLTENAARMRVERALDKLHGLLARRGIVSTTAALGVALAGQAATVAPAGLAATVTTAALATSAGGAALAAASGFMSVTTLQMGLAGALAVAGAAAWVTQTKSNAQFRAEIAGLRNETSALVAVRAENERLARRTAEAAELRGDDAAFERLQSEAGELRSRLAQIAREEQARASAARTRAGIFEIGQVDRTPAPRFQARPQYPFEMRRAGISGEVVVDFIVDTNGDVQDAYAVRSSHREFEAAAVQAVTKWKFKPGGKDGRDVSTHLQVPIVFALNPARAGNAAAK